MNFQRHNESEESKFLEPIKSFHLKDELCPDIWNDFEINEDVYEQLLQIGNDFFEGSKLKCEIKDIILTGSLSSYNWSKDYSDFDIHILIDFEDVDKNIELVKQYVDAYRANWNDKHDIKISGYEVETYIQDEKEIHIANGVYSILKNEWNKKPEKIDFNVDEQSITLKAEPVIKSVLELEKSIKKISYDKFITKLDKIWDKIKLYRKEGLESDGELSVGNLVFKLLRRNGIIGKIVNMKRKSYDEQFESLFIN